jgi:hypothetical protein
MDAARSFGHQGFYQGLGDAFPPVVRVDPEGAELAAIRVGLEDDEPDDPAVLLGDPQRICGHPGIVQPESPRELDGERDVLLTGFPDAHFRILYHAQNGLPDYII